MTERGLPIVDGAPACPFVAFDDDRDERAASPDHRHRCYAEPEPAPRALAHQEAYCLSSAFPVCPTFQDWARREAARSRNEPTPQLDPLAAAAAEPRPQRNPPRNWSAPPPWATRSDADRQREIWEDEQGGDEAESVPGAPPHARGRGLSGSFADRVAAGEGQPAPDAGPASVLPSASSLLPGAAGAVRGTGPGGAPAPQAPPPVEVAGDDWEDEDDGDDFDLEEPPVRRRRERDPDRAAALAGGGGGRSGGGGGRGGGGGGGPRPERRREGRAPEWERARPLEAYPTLRSRRLSELSVPPILVAVVALALAAAVLFALPGLLGFGNPSSGNGSAAPTTPVITPLVTPAPTPIPQPTDQLYTVQQGDTMSRIANKFDVELGDLIAANAETIPDPNKLQIGDQVIIPAKDPSELPAASEIPAAT